MTIKEYFQRQKKYKKPLFILCTAILIGYVIAWIYMMFTRTFTVGDYIGFAFILLYMIENFLIIFEVEPTEEEIQAEREELKQMIKEWEEKQAHSKEK